MHTFPDLKKLEKAYERELVVVGVHSGKFTTERESDGIRDALGRYAIGHPTVNDADYAIWKAYKAEAWPTMVVVDAKGRIAGRTRGEKQYEWAKDWIEKLIKEAEADGTLKRGALETSPERGAETFLRYPGKIAAAGERLYIADTLNHRIVTADLAGKVVDIVGKGEAGFADGSYGDAKFNWPQGVAIAGTTLYVADCENHRIRAVDLAKQAVTTVAGTGVQAYRPKGGEDLNSPWDVIVDGERMLIAMAGNHQIWALKGGRAAPWIGTGGENIKDGPHESAKLAQPSGLALGDGKLFIADSEVSAIREADDAEVRTLIGTDLFEFGDVDGGFEKAQLQHPLAVAYHEGRLYVADSYNHKIKVMDLAKGTIATWAGGGKPGSKDGRGAAAEFREPSGLAILGGKLYVADTNNHAIRACDLATAEVTTLTISK